MKRFIPILACVSLIVLQACHPEPFLSVSPDSLSFNESGGSQTVQISANYAWTASTSGSGFSVSPSSGEGNATVTVTAAPASSADAVSGTLSVKSEGLSASVSLSQDAKPTIILGDAVKVSSNGGPLEIAIQYNTDYTVEIEASAQSWIKFLRTKALSSGRLEFEIAVNEGGERSGKVTVKDNSGKAAPVSVTIIQEKEKSILAVGESVTVPSDGGTVEIDVQYNVDFTVKVESSAQSWLHYVETKSVHDGKLVFKVDTNDSASSRTGKVTLEDPSGEAGPISVTITQEEKTVLKVGEPTSVSSAGGSVYIPVEYNTDYTVEVEESAKSWIRIIRTKAVSSGQIELYVSENTGEERSGRVTVTDVSGKISPIVLTIIQKADEQLKIKQALMKIYDAMDGPNWKIEKKWDLSKDLNSWQGVRWNNGNLWLTFNGDFGLKGQFPDCFDDLSSCVYFWVQDEPGVTGTLPPSFASLKRLSLLLICFTSMTSLPDLFSGIPLEHTCIGGNELMTGPIPESLGESDGYLSDSKAIDGIHDCYLDIGGNGFTGDLPESWLRLGNKVSIYHHRMPGQIPDYFYSSENAAYFINMYINEGQIDEVRKNDPFYVKDYDIPGYWPKKGLNDVITGETIPYDEIVAGNKATVVFKWASWCGYSAALLPQLKKMYEKYHDAGLEIIARPGKGDEEGVRNQKSFLLENGYDKWYNFSSADLGFDDAFAMGEHGTPFANVIDNKGNIIFSSISNVSDPSRGRFGYVASNDLIPFLENIFGPLEEEDVYSSTDYSKDGKVVTLQKATVGKGINIVFLGDAYTDKDLKNGMYDVMMKQSMEEFFSIEPYKTFRDRFNVYDVNVVSKNGRTGTGYSTALGCVASGTTISITDAGVEKAFQYALKVPGINDRKNLLIGVLVNSTGRRGITQMNESLQSGVAFYASVSNTPSIFGPVIRHEAGGHGFAFLADEYGSDTGAPSAEFISEYNRLYSQYGWFPNVDFTNDPAKVKWSAFLSDERYKDEVGVFEGGGGYYTEGVYRPSVNSMMNHEVEYFNAPSRWAIYQRIMKLSGEECSFEKFLEYDAVNRTKVKEAAARPPLKAAGAPPRRFEPSPSPIIRR